MKEEYWELFMTSGKIDDYLNYKNSRKADGSSGRKERRESDYLCQAAPREISLFFCFL